MPTPHPQHDRFFRSAFCHPEVAAGFLQAVLPDQIERRIVWPSLTRITGHFVDPQLRQSETDLLFEAEYLGEGPPNRIALVLEHQSSPDPSMPRRLLRYCERAWGDDPAGKQKFLSPSVPVVLYQGRRPWKHSTQLADLFWKAARPLPWIPPFDFLLVDQTKIGPDEVVGEEWGRLAQLLLMGAAQPDQEAAAKDPAAAAKRNTIAERAAALMIELETRGEDERLKTYHSYAHGALPLDIMLRMKELMRQEESPAEERVLTLSDVMLAKGRAEGEQRATLGMVEGFLKAGASWTLIEKATGLNEARFLTLKAKPATAN